MFPFDDVIMSRNGSATVVSGLEMERGVNLVVFPNPNSNTQCGEAEDMGNVCESTVIQCGASTGAQTISISAATTSRSDNKMAISIRMTS